MKDFKNVKKILMVMLFAFIIMIVATDNVHAASERVTEYIYCGNTNVPKPVAGLVSITYTLLQIIVPIGIIFSGSIDIIKAVSASDADKIKKGQKKLVSRLIIGAIVFLVFSMIKFIVSMVSDGVGSGTDYSSCIDCLINNNCPEGSSPFID